MQYMQGNGKLRHVWYVHCDRPWQAFQNTREMKFVIINYSYILYHKTELVSELPVILAMKKTFFKNCQKFEPE